MKFDCGLTYGAKYETTLAQCRKNAKELREWRRCFAWLPVRIGDNDCRWLEFVERRYPSAVASRSSFGSEWPCVVKGLCEYRAIERE